MAYAIMRLQKHQGGGGLSGSAQHMMRDRETPNADADVENEIYIGSEKPLQDIQKRINQGDGVVRKNAVQAIEYLLTYSPDWEVWQKVKDAPREKQLAALKPWVKSSYEWLCESFGGRDNLVHMQLHLDETTPHLTGYVVPMADISAKRSKGSLGLNAAEYLGGSRGRLSELQDTYAEAVAQHGLERGSRRSVATHQSVREWYAAVDAVEQRGAKIDVPTVEPPVGKKALVGNKRTFTTEELTSWAVGETERIQGDVSAQVETLVQAAAMGAGMHHTLSAARWERDAACAGIEYEREQRDKADKERDKADKERDEAQSVAEMSHAWAKEKASEIEEIDNLRAEAADLRKRNAELMTQAAEADRLKTENGVLGKELKAAQESDERLRGHLVKALDEWKDSSVKTARGIPMDWFVQQEPILKNAFDRGEIEFHKSKRGALYALVKHGEDKGVTRCRNCIDLYLAHPTTKERLFTEDKEAQVTMAGHLICNVAQREWERVADLMQQDTKEELAAKAEKVAKEAEAAHKRMQQQATRSQGMRFS